MENSGWKLVEKDDMDKREKGSGSSRLGSRQLVFKPISRI